MQLEVPLAAGAQRQGQVDRLAAPDNSQLFTDAPPALAFWGNVGSVIPARIAYHLDLHGPAVAEH